MRFQYTIEMNSGNPQSMEGTELRLTETFVMIKDSVRVTPRGSNIERPISYVKWAAPANSVKLIRTEPITGENTG